VIALWLGHESIEGRFLASCRASTPGQEETVVPWSLDDQFLGQCRRTANVECVTGNRRSTDLGQRGVERLLSCYTNGNSRPEAEVVAG